MLLGSATLIVEGYDARGGTGQVGHDEPDARVQLARMPFDLGEDPPGLVPGAGLVAEAGIVTPHVVRRPADGALEEMADAVLEHLVGGNPNGVLETLGFQELVDLGRGEGDIATEVPVVRKNLVHQPPTAMFRYLLVL